MENAINSKSNQPQELSLSESLEDYIEAIFRILLEKHEVKPKDIAQVMHVAGASVTGALRALTEKGLIRYAPYDGISLTPLGETIAEDVYNRHRKLKAFFINILQVGETEADETACRMEHAISSSILNKLVKFAEFIEHCPRGGQLWISGFEHTCSPNDDGKSCRECMMATMKRFEQKKKKSLTTNDTRTKK